MRRRCRRRRRSPSRPGCGPSAGGRAPAARATFARRFSGAQRRRARPRHPARSSRSWPSRRSCSSGRSRRSRPRPVSRWSRRRRRTSSAPTSSGRDILNMTVHGARISMSIGLMATLITIFVGALIGVISGFVGGRVDGALMRVTDFFLVLPTFVLAIILAPVILEIIGVRGRDPRAAGDAARDRRGHRHHVAGRSTARDHPVADAVDPGADVRRPRPRDRQRPGHIMRRHILPNVVNLIVAQAVITFAAAVFTETSLSFIGLGDPFAPSWGQILDSAQGSGAPGLGAWWYFVPPAACVVLVVLSFTLVGNALDDILNPKSADPPMSDPRDLLHVADDLHADDLGPRATSRRPRGGTRGRGGARGRARGPCGARCRGRARRPRDDARPPAVAAAEAGRPVRAAARRPGPADAFQARRRLGEGGRRGQLSAERRRGPRASPANRAAARRRPRCPSSACCRRTRGSARAAASSSTASTWCPRPRTSCGAIAGARSASSSRAP